MLNTDLIPVEQFTNGADVMAAFRQRQARRRALEAPKAPAKQLISLTEDHREVREIKLNEDFKNKAKKKKTLMFAPPAPVQAIEPRFIWEMPEEVVLEAPEWREPTMKQVAIYICALHGVSFEDLKSIRRHRHVAVARQHFAFLCRKWTARSLPEIGRFIDKDHTTILHGIRKIEDMKVQRHTPHVRRERIIQRQLEK